MIVNVFVIITIMNVLVIVMNEFAIEMIMNVFVICQDNYEQGTREQSNATEFA